MVMDLIDRREAIKAIEELPNCDNGYSDAYDKAQIIGTLEEVPPADTDLSDYSDKLWRAAYERGKKEAQADAESAYAEGWTAAESKYREMMPTVKLADAPGQIERRRQ